MLKNNRYFLTVAWVGLIAWGSAACSSTDPPNLVRGQSGAPGSSGTATPGAAASSDATAQYSIHATQAAHDAMGIDRWAFHLPNANQLVLIGEQADGTPVASTRLSWNLSTPSGDPLLFRVEAFTSTTPGVIAVRKSDSRIIGYQESDRDKAFLKLAYSDLSTLTKGGKSIPTAYDNGPSGDCLIAMFGTAISFLGVATTCPLSWTGILAVGCVISIVGAGASIAGMSSCNAKCSGNFVEQCSTVGRSQQCTCVCP